MSDILPEATTGIVPDDGLIVMAVPPLKKGRLGVINVSVVNGDGHQVCRVRFLAEGPKSNGDLVLINAMGCEGYSYSSAFEQWES